MSTKNKKPPFSFATAFDQAFADRSRVFAHDRTKSLGASECFGCARKSYYNKFLTPDRVIEEWGMMERGNLIEDHYMVPFLRTIFGEDRCKIMGSEQVTLFDQKASATPDGLLINIDRDVLKEYGIKDIGASKSLVAECKSFDPRAHRHDADPVHKGQTQMQMGMIRRDKKYPNPTHGMVMYVNASDLRDTRIFPVAYDDRVYNIGLKRADALFAAEKPEDLMAEGAYSGECDYCPHTDECAAANVRIFDGNTDSGTFDKADIQTMEDMIAERIDAKTQEKEWATARKEVEDKIKKMMTKINRRVMDNGSWRVTWSKVNGKDRLDHDALKKEGIDLDDYKTKGPDYTRLMIKEK